MSLRTGDPQHCSNKTGGYKNQVTTAIINNKRTYVITAPTSNQRSSATLEPRKCAGIQSRHSPASSSLSLPDAECPESESPESVRRESDCETEEDLIGLTTVMGNEASGASGRRDHRRKGKSRQTADSARSSNMTAPVTSPVTDSATLHDASERSPVAAGSDDDNDLSRHVSNHPPMEADIQNDSKLCKGADSKNIEFYMNRIESVPDGAKIEVILKDWFGDYDLLEKHHGYIQWLFPIPTKGLNDLAQELKPHEAEYLRDSRVARTRLFRAYRLMLDFYGLQLDSAQSGRVSRAAHWESRLAHLNRSSHNFMRITRILECFAELGVARLQRPFAERLIYEVFKTGTLRSARRSCRSFWVKAVVNDDDYDYLIDLIDKLTKPGSRR